MLTRFVRIQLVIFTIASIIGVAVMVFAYLQAPMLLGVGRINVKVELPATGGLYQFGNVTYRGVEVGKVISVELIDRGAVATLSLKTSPKIPADLKAEVRSMSAVGEQYVELLPRTDSAPYLQDGDVVAMENTGIPQQVGPMLDQLSALVDSIPKDRLSSLLDESFKAFNGAGYDFGSLLDSASTISRDANAISDQTRALIDDSGSFLDAQAQTTDATRVWAASLAGITGQLATNDGEIRSLLQNGPGFAQEVSRLLDAVKPTLPVLLADLTTIGKIGVVYNASLEQLLVLLPPYVAATQTYSTINHPAGIPGGDFTLGIGDPPACTVGFLPPSAWRSPSDTSIVDTPDDIYCKLPQDSPIAVRGARNYPCMEHPGKRAPTVQLCNSPEGFQPLAQRQHALGPYPIDPNLISQGVPPDSRALPDSNIYGPLDGSPLPPGVAAPPPGAAPGPVPPPTMPQPVGPLPPGPVLLTNPPEGAGPLPGPVAGAPAPEVGVVPSGYAGSDPGGPSVAFATYNPRTGEYLAPDGNLYTQTDLVKTPTSWQDLMAT
jgi:virulence factor Mce-like protein